MQAAVLFALLGAAAALATDGAAKVTPVQKVIGMLEDMVKKGQKEKADEEIQYAAYKTWCATTTTEKQKAIEEGNEKIEGLEADIEKFESDARDLGNEVAALDEDISTWEGDTKAAGKVREIENIDYTRTHKDYTESIEALEDGIDTLKAQNHDVAQAGSSLLQLKKANFLTPQASKAIEAFLAQDPSLADENLALAAPEAAGFESQLQGILDMLEKLKGKFEDERTELEKQETAGKNAFEMLSMDLKMQLDAAGEARTEKSEAKAKALQFAADARGDLMDTTTTRDDDTKYLSDLTATCDLKASAFVERQGVRQAEIEALGKAVEILSGGAVSGAAEKHLPQLIQVTPKATSLAQLRAEGNAPDQRRVARFLRDQAKMIDSRILSMIAVRLEADPFKKCKKMIKDLIVKLMEEATEEAETEGFCNKELKANEHTRKEKTATVEALYADIDELGASVNTLAEEIAKLSKELVDLEAAMKTATDNRNAERLKNFNTIQDAKDAQVAVSQAMSVLKEFYEGVASSTALAQTGKGAKQPEIFDSPYRGMGAESGGIIGMIEVVGSDFMRLEAETSAQEESADKEYKEYMNDAEVDKTQKTKDMQHKTEFQTAQQQALQEKKSDLAGTEKELDAAMKTYEKLKPTCIAGGEESYEERTAKRKEEIESLQEALRILNGEDIAFVQG